MEILKKLFKSDGVTGLCELNRRANSNKSNRINHFTPQYVSYEQSNLGRIYSESINQQNTVFLF